MSQVIVGTGSLRYELVEGWEQLPEGWVHRDVAGVANDSEGNVYLFCRGDRPVIVYSREGKLLDTWGQGDFTMRTHGMFMDHDSLLLVDDGAGSVGRYGLKGGLQSRFGPVGEKSDTGYDGKDSATITHAGPPFNRPTNASVAPAGDLYVSDGYGNSRIHHYSSDGELLGSWGEPGEGPGQFHIPHSVWVHTDGRVFVADRHNDRIQIFTPAGEYITEWTDVQRPQDIFIQDGLVYVAELGWIKGLVSHRRGPILEEEPGRLSIFDLEGNLLSRWSDGDPTRPGYFIAPHGISVDDEGSIYLAEVTYTIGVSRGRAPADAHTFQKFARI
ncbi:MAG TPA: peptidyl-alpha-hydroxyglycine alpha-amidating lyase family protein [Galbitalea sp.]|nr:peptidyl-alpha-hydroxyglycine alpha-amidating lyase family protein [Galbitalea sp.]